jgi:hypothetical protein
VAFLRRIVRSLEARFHTHSLSPRDLAGIAGEADALQYLSDAIVTAWRANPLVPDPRNPGKQREGDILVYAGGNLYAIEVKNFSGRLQYVDSERRQLLQEKFGRDGRTLYQKIHRNPWFQANSFVGPLKAHLTRLDRRFERLFFFPAAAYVGACDVSAIYDFEKGVMRAEELPAFFRSKVHPKFGDRTTQWIIDGIQRVPTHDLVMTTDGQAFRGRFIDPALRFKTVLGSVWEIRFAEMQRALLTRTSFSDHDDMTVWYRDGRRQPFMVAAGAVRCRNFEGTTISHVLQNVAEIRPGDPGAQGLARPQSPDIQCLKLSID